MTNWTSVSSSSFFHAAIFPVPSPPAPVLQVQSTSPKHKLNFMIYYISFSGFFFAVSVRSIK